MLPLRRWEDALRAAYSVFKEEIGRNAAFLHAGEWMLDNFYVIEQTLHQIEVDLPRDFFDQLPKLRHAGHHPVPRVFGLAGAWVGYCTSQLDLDQTTALLQAYQEVTPLTIGELWAFPTMLRIAILEQLTSAAAAITGVPAPDTPERPSFMSTSPPLGSERRSKNTIVAESFLGLRLLSTTDWQDFFEQSSLVDRILRDDPAEIYASMDFDTRNHYRTVVEELARHSDHSEEAVARTALEICLAAQSASETNRSVRRNHIGYYLVDEGRPLLEARLGFKPGRQVRLRGWFLARPTATYLGSIGLVTLLIILALVTYAISSGGSPAMAALAGLLGLVLASEAAISVVHWRITHRVTPRKLPRMDFSEGIPPGNRTMVVIPTLLANVEELDSLLHNLEMCYLSNTDPELGFALLTDFTDAPTRTMVEDENLLSMAKSGVENLNRKYNQAAPFFLFHRRREWNPSESIWMGWERKRGKLAEFNRLLLGAGETTYTTQVGNLAILPNIRYVITLDADTALPHRSASRLVGTLAHPLNRAEFSADGRTVAAGYTVLQPRVAIKPTSANRSRFARIFAGDAGYDLYTLAVSDVYQDLFGEGSYVGKGIYDVAAFERSLVGQVRENTLLSHDLFEGIYGRAALVTDIVLYEEYPALYLDYTRRLRRWIRGDWQLLPWLYPIVRTQSGLSPNRLSVISRWKVFDNLRRSLLPPSMLAFLAAAWLFLPGSPLVWTAFALLPTGWPILVQAFQVLGRNPGPRDRAGRFERIRIPLARWLLNLLFLPHEALLTLGAIRTTLARLISQKKLLQWTSAAHAARAFRLTDRGGTWLEMSGSLVIAGALAAAVAAIRPGGLAVAAPLLIAWLFAPQAAYWISRPLTRRAAPLSGPDSREVRRLARRTWSFFEQFVGPNEQWLPPDHFQESPRGSVAHYTTPTNIGLYLLATLAAHDLGYVGLLDMEVRLRSAFNTMAKLEHYRGHVLNWLDTQTLAALPPRYVSTVDSGNLGACLVVLQQGLQSLAGAPLIDRQRWQGLFTILDILKQMILELDGFEPSGKPIALELDAVCDRLVDVQDHPENWLDELAWLSGEGWKPFSNLLMDWVEAHPDLDPEPLGGLRHYLDAVQQHVNSLLRDIGLLAPWLAGPDDGVVETACAADPETVNPWRAYQASLPSELPVLGEATEVYDRIRVALIRCRAQIPDSRLQDWCRRLEVSLASASTAVTTLLVGYKDLAAEANAAVNSMDFRFLFDNRRRVFHIGYNVATEKLDGSYYDLLASEARIASLIAIARGDVPLSHWQHLGRPVTKVDGKLVLLSWSGTMFEYLMPTLMMRHYEGTFLFDSCLAAIDAQIAYGREKNIPWGVSESGYYAFDAGQNYQYHAFGLPDLSYKRDLPDNLVVAPYASLLALSLRRQETLGNLRRLENLDMLGRFGLYEALDYTRTRLPDGQENAIVKSYMAHHQGMILLAAANALLDDVMVRRFHANQRIQSIELLLQEKIPQGVHLEYPHTDEIIDLPPVVARPVRSAAWRVPVDSPVPLVHFLSQLDYRLLITNTGGGYSQWGDFALTRWQADTTLDDSGTWIYLQDTELPPGVFWTAACRPVGSAPDQQEAFFSPHQVEFRRRDHDISLRTEITVSLDGVEIRRVNILNDSDRPRKIKVTSYGEVVLAGQIADQRHPAFNKLFIKSEYLPEENALFFDRRSRSPEEKPVVLIHALVNEAGTRVSGEHESDRARFLGRGRTPRRPAALENEAKRLSATTGNTLDPIFALAQEINLKAHGKTSVTFLTLAAGSRAEALEKLSRYRSKQSIHGAFAEVRAQAERELLEMGLNAFNVEHIQGVLSALIYPSEWLRAAPHRIARNARGQSDLWGFGISGDLPILLLRIRKNDSGLLLEALQAYAYWRKRNVKINLVILNEEASGYALDQNNAIKRQIVRLGGESWLNQPDGIFLLLTDQLQEAELVLLETVAGVILDDEQGTLAEHTARLARQTNRLPKFNPSLPFTQDMYAGEPLERPTELLMDNGLGGFSPDGKEYLIYLQPGQHTPHPWINVIANPQFGFLVSEAGSGCTWAENSGENRLSPWRNDPVSDQPGEVLYLRDEETGRVWTPTPLPAGGETACLIRHGAGYSIFESRSHGLDLHLRLFAAADAPVKIAQLRLENRSDRHRRITATYYIEWVLGNSRQASQAYILPEFIHGTHALLAQNPLNADFGARVAFLAAGKEPHGVTADRTEFLGRNGSLHAPAALERIGLASKVNAGLDPCAAIQLHVDLAPGQSDEIFFLIGEGAGREESLDLIGAFQVEGRVEASWQEVGSMWDEILGSATIRTPEPSMDIMLNRWLLYQAVACRLWGRTALYQSSGAFGFRDQLQDVLALFHSQPDLARRQILNAARRQFELGDVLHWWIPPSGRGVRTRFSDDLLWLPYVTAEYVSATGDAAILDEQIPFLRAEALKPGEEERFTLFETSAEGHSLYEHCRRAIEKGATSGSHGLPLMAAGDWNDGMNRVGIGGHGESIWLGWFLHAALERFASLAVLKAEDPAPFLERAAVLSTALETHAWDGDWYLRAFYDDGSKLGSHENDECRIDSIAQSWGVLSGAADPARASQAMQSVDRLLVDEAERIILLFTPPFDRTERDPGYIKAYPPGVRENGGQYTHAAIWAVAAMAELGQGDRAETLFRMLNPIHHADTPEKVARYQVEPYVIAADIYSQAPHEGSGGWTWYTGSAGWMYGLGLRWILGVVRTGSALKIDPCIPRRWPGFELDYRFGTTEYRIRVENPDQVSRGIREVIIDGEVGSGASIPLVDDGRPHAVRIVMGEGFQ
ncbi:MAG TPA: glucoamylase family protein [Anaerolineales bacterium]|nr:glucoamylase family protein [Anaerolineales bacterium]